MKAFPRRRSIVDADDRDIGGVEQMPDDGGADEAGASRHEDHDPLWLMGSPSLSMITAQTRSAFAARENRRTFPGQRFQRCDFMKL